MNTNETFKNFILRTNQHEFIQTFNINIIPNGKYTYKKMLSILRPTTSDATKIFNKTRTLYVKEKYNNCTHTHISDAPIR